MESLIYDPFLSSLATPSFSPGRISAGETTWQTELKTFRSRNVLRGHLVQSPADSPAGIFPKCHDIWLLLNIPPRMMIAQLRDLISL